MIAPSSLRAVWQEDLLRSDLPTRARLAGLTLAARAGTHGTTVSTTAPEVAALAGYSTATALRALLDLHQSGYLDRTPQRPMTGRSPARTDFGLTMPGRIWEER